MRGTFTDDGGTRGSAHSHADSARTLIDDYLADQQRLQTPVQRFSEAHDRQSLADQSALWRDLIPLSEPGPGEQYAFEVDVDRCTGCKACVAGCHSLNGLEEEETWRDVGLLLGGTRSQPFQQTITTACHHCADPACLNGCPVLAYEKDPITGIVRHLDDQCIGCQYCVLKCPYDVPKYSERLGIVRKCDMCHSRLSVGEAPACAQACPTQAIRIVTVQTQAPNGTVHPGQNQDFLENAPSPDYTLPTTRYLTRRNWPRNVESADAHALRPQPAHWPLVFMLTLLPMAVGCFTIDALKVHSGAGLPMAGWLAASLGLFASVFHLGKPLRAWRIFLGLRRSWLSREAVVFGGWFGLISGWLFLRVQWPIDAVAKIALQANAFLSVREQSLLSQLVSVIGLLGLFCSAMIYIDTRRPFWRASQTFPRFFGTAAALGSAMVYALYPDNHYAIALMAVLVGKLGVETRCFRVLDDEDESPTPERQTANVLAGPLRGVTAFRYLSAFAVIFICASGLVRTAPDAMRWCLFALVLLSEGVERSLFFRAVFAPKMPGVPGP